jgi:hypothetical protein
MMKSRNSNPSSSNRKVSRFSITIDQEKAKSGLENFTQINEEDWNVLQGYFGL